MKYIFKDIPGFHFTEDEKVEVLNNNVLKEFDGSYEYLVNYHQKLKYHYYRFQVVRSHLYNLIMKIIYIYYVTLLTNKGILPSFLIDEKTTLSTEKTPDPILRFFKDDANFISKNFLFSIFPFTGLFIRIFVLSIR